MSKRGLFLVLDGVDGAGKSTQVRLLADWLRERGETPLCVRDPGGTKLGERLRTLLLDPASEMEMNAETLLYLASRAQLIAEVVRPAIEQGQTVVCDRFELSTIVYQGYAGGVPPEAIRSACELARGDCVPDRTMILDLDPAAAATREDRQRDRIERRGREYFERVRNGFLAEAALDRSRATVIDAVRPVEEVHRAIRGEVERALARRRA